MKQNPDKTDFTNLPRRQPYLGHVPRPFEGYRSTPSMADIGQSESAEVLALSANARYHCEYVGYLGERAWPVISETNSIAGAS